MGLFDTVKLKAGELAADAERAGRVAAAQTHLVTLQSDVRKAERGLGQTAFALLELGELRHPDLDAAAAALREAHEALRLKELEIAGLRDGPASPAPDREEPVAGDGATDEDDDAAAGREAAPGDEPAGGADAGPDTDARGDGAQGTAG